jgi:hypothetical protein
MPKRTRFEQGYENGKLNAVAYVSYLIKEHLDKEHDISKFKEEFEKQFKNYIPAFGKTEPTEYEKKHCYCKTHKYRGISVDIFDDDAGQCFYFYYKGKSYGCGTYNLFPEGEIESVIDRDLDFIHSFAEDNKDWFGAYLNYADINHKTARFTFRGEEIQVYDVTDGIDTIIEDCKHKLTVLFASEEFQKMEAERKARGSLYFSELMENYKKDGE